MTIYERLLQGNQEWAKAKLSQDPDFFSRLEHQQSPEFLWIGCSDSRVSANEITNTDPGEIFVHRNIANQVVLTDLNLMSVVDFAVNFLKVKHIIVCGHYGCGGVIAAASKSDFNPVLNMWLRNLKDIIKINDDELSRINDEDTRLNRIVELSVAAQVANLAKTSLIQRAWKKGDGPHLHGWVYSLSDGIINPLVEMVAGSEVDPFYSFDL